MVETAKRIVKKPHLRGGMKHVATGKESPSSTTLTKGLVLMEALAEAGSPISLSELVRKVGLPKTTCHRILSILVNERMVRFEKNSRTYSTGFRFMSLAFRTWRNLDIRQAASDEMQRLGDLTGENIHLAVPDGNEIVYIDRVESRRILRLHSAIGNRASVHCTALGKSMVAAMPPERRERIVASIDFQRVAQDTITDPEKYLEDLDEVQRRGFALAIREHQSDVCGVAAGIRDFRGEVAGAVCVSASVYNTDRDKLIGWAPAVMEAATRISHNLGWMD